MRFWYFTDVLPIHIYKLGHTTLLIIAITFCEHLVT